MPASFPDFTDAEMAEVRRINRQLRWSPRFRAPTRVGRLMIQRGHDPRLRLDLLRRLLADRQSWRLADGAMPVPAWASSAPQTYAC